jgi:hypothetical protein
MKLNRFVVIAVLAIGSAFAFSPEASAVSPRNPYRSFNLSGVNYGSMQWERSQRQGKRVWPYYNTPSRSSSRSSTVVVGGVGAGGGAAVMPSKSYRSSRTYRRR